MSLRFRRDKLFVGLHLNVRGMSFVSKGIRFILGSWSSHDCHIGKNAKDAWVVKEANAEGNVETLLEAYEKQIAAGKCEVHALLPITGLRVSDKTPGVITQEDREKADAWWDKKIKGKPYDYWAIGEFLWKWIRRGSFAAKQVGNALARRVPAIGSAKLAVKIARTKVRRTIARMKGKMAAEYGWSWANYCTEAEQDDYVNGPGIDPYLGKANVTPLDTELLTKSGEFINITDSVMEEVT